MKKINNETDYEQIIAKLDSLMAKGSENVSKEELGEIRSLAELAQDYEQSIYVIDAPTTLEGMIEMRVFEMKLNQKELVHKLDVSPAKLSLILNGKQRADIRFLKAVYKQLKIDAEFVLEH